MTTRREATGMAVRDQGAGDGEATGRPWRVSVNGGRDENALYLSSESEGYVPLATPYREDAFTAAEEASCIEGRERCAKARANAALIVRAVNAHAGLVAVVEAYLRLAGTSRQPSQALYEQAVAALASARGNGAV